MTRIHARFEFREGTTAEWENANPILLSGEPGWDKELKILKVGDEVTPWNDLPPVNADPGSLLALLEHINHATPHPIYDDGPSLQLLYENAKV